MFFPQLHLYCTIINNIQFLFSPGLLPRSETNPNMSNVYFMFTSDCWIQLISGKLVISLFINCFIFHSFHRDIFLNVVEIYVCWCCQRTRTMLNKVGGVKYLNVFHVHDILLKLYIAGSLKIMFLHVFIYSTIEYYCIVDLMNKMWGLRQNYLVTTSWTCNKNI